MWNATLARLAHEIVVAQAAVAPATEPAQAQPEGGLAGFLRGPGLMLIAFAAIFYFLMFRPNIQQEKRRKEMLSALSKGDEVVTNGGIYGTVIGLTDQTVTLKVSEDPVTKMKFARAAIARVHPGDEQKSS